MSCRLQREALIPDIPMCNGIPDPEYSIECGVQELKRALELAGCQGPTDMEHIKLALAGL